MKKHYYVVLNMLGAAMFIIALAGCGQSTTTDATGATTTTSSNASAAIDGAALYATDCLSCHGPLATSDKRNATAAMIRFGITNDLGGMGQFVSLSAEQIQALVSILSSSISGTTTSTQGQIDGAALYATDCESCHGPLGTSSKTGATVTMIQTAISSNFGGMKQFSSLTPAQIQALADALSTLPTSTPTPTPTPTSVDGAALYATNCQSCHGPLATSSKLGATVAMIQTGISSNFGGMSQFSAFSAAQIQAIAAAMAVTPTPTPTPTPAPTPAPIDGAALYTTDCSGCHGPLATSSKKGATVASIQTGISSNFGGMSQFATLTSAQIQAIATALAVTPTPTPTPIDGAALYTTDCSGCHGPLATSSKLGATVAMIQTGISSNFGGMSQFSTLTTVQIQALSTALSSSTTSTTPVPVPTDGPSLYTMYCSGCHRALASSSVRGATVSDIQSEIRSNSAMQQFSSLTAAQLQAIATALH